VLGLTLWETQAQILRALARPTPTGAPRQVAVRSAHGIGKSFVAAAAAVWWTYCHEPSLVLTTAPAKRQVERILWPEIRRHWQNARVPLSGHCLKTRLDASDTQTAFGFTTREPEKGAGLHAEHLLIIVDEASGVPDGFFEVLQGALTSAHCALLLIGNPTKAEGQFYTAFSSEQWDTFSISAYDTPNFHTGPGEPLPYPGLVTPAWAEARRLEWGEDSDPYRVRVLGQFPKASADTLIPLGWIEAAEKGDELEPGEVVFGLDVARYGDCESVLSIRRGLTLAHLEAWQGYDLMETVGKVVAAAQLWQPARIIVDAVGMGAGVVDRLTELAPGPAIIPFSSGEKPLSADFSNQRDEAYWNLRELYRHEQIRHAGDWKRLTGQLTALKYRYGSRGYVQIESKDDLRRRGKASPDWADSVALCFCHPFVGALPGASGHTRKAERLF
jgi:phage terminase large subunit